MSISSADLFSIGVVPLPTGATRIAHCREGAGRGAEGSGCRNNAQTLTRCLPLDAASVFVTWIYTYRRAEHYHQHTRTHHNVLQQNSCVFTLIREEKKPSGGGRGAILRKLVCWSAWGVQLVSWLHATHFSQCLFGWQEFITWTPASLVLIWQ